MKTRIRKEKAENRADSKVDVVIPVYKPDEKLKRLIEMLGKQSVPPGQLILMVTVDVDVDVDEEKPENGEEFQLERFLPEARKQEGRLSETEKTEVVGEQKPTLPKIEVHRLKKSEFNHGLTRNRGVGFSEAEVIILMTDDAVPNDCYLIEQLLLGLSDEKTAVCYARQLPAEDAELPERFSREFNYPPESRRKTSEDLETLGIKAFFCSNVCAAYKRRIFEELGGFTETIFNEDMIFARKALDAGYAIQYQAEAQVIHSHRFSNMEQLRRNYDLAISQKRHPEVFSDVSSEKEGFKYVGKAYSYFRQNHRGYLILPFAVTCGFRFLGYRLGKLFG
ncbi:MAG: glycosyltransferase [Lachnospiraceae bacterium]|nr:glycosyltransferase [Lachnospiraceae bacterium]